MMPLVKNFMSGDFKILSCNLSPQAAFSQLAGCRYGVIENDRQQALGVITGVELEAAIAANKTSLVPDVLTHPQIFQVSAETEIQNLIDSPLLKPALQNNKVILVVNSCNRVIGILRADTILRLVEDSSNAQRGMFSFVMPRMNMGTQLAGSLSPLVALYPCSECWYVNQLSAEQGTLLSYGAPTPAPTCQNPDPNVPPHPLKFI